MWSPAVQAGAAEDAYAAAQTSFRELKAMPEEKKKFRHHWQASIDRFKAVAEKYPKSPVADDALFTQGQLYYDLYDVSRLKSDLQSAVDAWKSCAQKYPGSNYADDSLFWEAKAMHLLGRHEQEVAALHLVIEKYAKGDMVRDAKKALAKIDETGEVADTTPKATPSPAAVAVVEVTPTPKSTPLAIAAATPIGAVIAPPVTSGGQISDAAQQVHKVKVISNDGYTRVVIYAGGSVHWEAHQIKAEKDKPPRIYVDLVKAHVGEDLKKEAPKLDNNWEIPIEDGLLKRARVAQFDGETVRVVLDVASMKRWEIIPFDDPFRLVIDIYGVTSEVPIATPVLVAAATPVPGGSPAAVAKATPSDAPTPVPAATLTADELARFREKAMKRTGISLTDQLGLKFGRIYVDAGHGGYDPGAIGPTNVREKDVNLAIAKLLQKKLIERGYDAILTRKDDTFLELEERTGIANGGRGDLFVSIHCNSVDKKGNRNASGVEVYYADLPSDGASARLSAMENATSEKHMSDLEKMLSSLMRSEFTENSGGLAIAVQKGLVDAVKKVNPDLKTHANGVKSALFYVCLTAHMPAILVETSFISNPKEEKRLADPKYQETIADGVASAIDGYLDEQAKKPVVKADASEPAPASGNSAGDLDDPAPRTAKKRHADKRR